MIYRAHITMAVAFALGITALNPIAASDQAAVTKEMLGIAKEEYERDFKSGGSSADLHELLNWSARWMECELDLAKDTDKTAAFDQAISRLEKVIEYVAASEKRGLLSPDDSSLVQYALLDVKRQRAVFKHADDSTLTAIAKEMLDIANKRYDYATKQFSVGYIDKDQLNAARFSFLDSQHMLSKAR